jgi:TolB-like protein/class 3 adenylate cyclase
MSEDRRHIAVIFTDIVGYTKLMGENEDKAFDMLKRNHTIHATLIKKYNGKLVKEIGDGTLASFPLASDAVRCAMDIQKEAKSQNIPLKIGIHQGEMVMAGGDVLGDGVNVASRLQESAEEGCISISGAVYRDVKNKAGITAEFLEDKEYKNVDEPVKVYNVLCGEKEEVQEALPEKSLNKRSYYIIGGIVGLFLVVALIWIFYPNQQAIVQEIVVDKSIAVLPFTDMSPDKDQEYFSDGMMDAILMHLCKIGDLKVTSRTSIMQYKGTTKTTPQIAEELGVAHILEGSVSKSGDRIRIIAQLIDATNDKHLWAETYEKDISDVFAIQGEVAQKIASSLKAQLSTDVKERIEAEPTDNLAAYDYYLKGNEAYWRVWSAIDDKPAFESIDYYEKAIELDVNFSLAYTGLGRSFWWLAGIASNTDRPDLYRKSKMYLKKAIELDPYNGWAYAEMSVVTQVWDWDSTATRRNQEMAIKLMPNDPNAYIHKFWFEARLRNCDQMELIKNYFKKFWEGIDHPMSFMSLNTLFCQKRYAEIAQIADEYWTEDIFNQQAFPIFFSYLMLDEYQKAEKVVTYSKEHFAQKNFFYFFDGILKARMSDKVAAIAMCDSLMQGNSFNGGVALIYAALKNKGKMYEYMDIAISNREPLHAYIWLFPEFVNCSDDKEFQRISQEIWIPRESSE